MEFEWDEEKRKLNIGKHNIDFTAVARMFAQGTNVIEIDVRRDYGEQRYNLIGRLENRILTVTFTRRVGLIRIISARPAHRKERARYGQKED